jgi:SAM-dependent methyltransferase
MPGRDFHRKALQTLFSAANIQPMTNSENPGHGTCRICGGAGGALLAAREMMFGTRETFAYFQCSSCGCLQIDHVPDDLAPYYPDDYYSYAANQKRVRPWKKFVRAARARWAIERKGVLGPLFNAANKVDPLLMMYGDIGVRLSDRVLDVGGGGGGLVQKLRTAGFSDVLAIDPFLATDEVIADGVVVARRCDVFSYEGTADFISFHHSYEHMDRQLDILVQTKDILAPGGRVLIRIPTVSSYAWETYGMDWVSLDPPRHLYLHSHDSIRYLADKAGYSIDKMWCDSYAFQFWGSEQYQRDIPLTAENSYAKNPSASSYTASDIATLEERSKELNDAMKGDSLCVLMSVPS